MRTFKITAGRGFYSLNGWEFQVEDDATEDEINEAARICVLDKLDYGIKEVGRPAKEETC